MRRYDSIKIKMEPITSKKESMCYPEKKTEDKVRSKIHMPDCNERNV